MKIFFALIKSKKIAIPLGMVVLFCLLYFHHKENEIEQLKARAAHRFEQISSSLFIPVEKFGYLPAVLAKQTRVSDALRENAGEPSIDRANQYLEELNRLIETDVIYLINPQGVTVASSNWRTTTSFVGRNFSYRPYFKDAIQGGAGRFYAMGTTTRIPGFYISYPVRESGRILGVVAVKVGLEKLDQGWHKADYEVTVSDEHGINFLSSNPDWKYRPMDRLAAEAMRNINATRQYEEILKDPLPVVNAKVFDNNTRHLEIRKSGPRGGTSTTVPYLLHSQKLSWSDWKINIFIRADHAHEDALLDTLLTMLGISFVVVAFLYWKELNRRVKEKEKAGAAIALAHSELENKHQRLQQLTNELQHAATTDPLTGIYNRRFFFDTVNKWLSGVTRHHLTLSVIVLDVDNFKDINDTHGHAMGDYVLHEISTLCAQNLRNEDVFARMGGEEFVIALLNTSGQDALETAERVRRQIMNHRFQTKEASIQVTISGGVSQYRSPEPSIDATIRRADLALYKAKHLGRNRVDAEGLSEYASPASDTKEFQPEET